MKINLPFVAIVGAGQVGATAAQRILEKDLADVVLYDVVDGLAAGKALDLMQASAIEGHRRQILGSASFEACKGAEIVVVTAGLARKPGMSREDLLAANTRIVCEVCGNIRRYAPEAKVIMVTNPLDIMTHLAREKTGFDARRVFGMAGILDGARMRYFIAEKLSVAACDVNAMVLGGHGDLMVPVSSQAAVCEKYCRP
jgi:malate dehydrogenase